MSSVLIELRKEKRTGIVPLLLAVGAVGSIYAMVNFIVRGDALLSMPLDPMDVLLTQLYGMIIVLDMFGIVVAGCMVYNMEFKGSAIKKMLMLPMNIAHMYLSKFAILTACLLIAVAMQNLTLAIIGTSSLPAGTFDPWRVISFAGYSFVTSLPVLSLMLLVSSRVENMWVPLGIGVAGFLSGMALASIESPLLLLHPFVVMLEPAVAMSSEPNMWVFFAALLETTIFTALGLWLSKNGRYE